VYDVHEDVGCRGEAATIILGRVGMCQTDIATYQLR